ncbi:MAG: hypothetical protein H3C68_01465 [Deltaproteobacteria bacterium]|nr:hypothetical protein [Deltaproteobacteria bacterium]MBZ0219077.1 hypothetical protein [Deltaproteobacteria bacterium]
MPLPTTLERVLGTIDFAKDKLKSLENGLPRNYEYYELRLRLKADISIAAGGATPFTEGFWKLLKRVEVVANGNSIIKSIDGAGLGRMAQFLDEKLPNYSAVPNAEGANQSLTAYLPVHFAMPRSVKPIDSLLNAPLFSSLDLNILWGSENDVYSANAANATINSADVAIESLEETSEKVLGGSVHKVHMLEKEVTASTSEFSIPLNGVTRYRGFLINADVDGNPNNSVINSVQLKDGQNIFRHRKWAHLQDNNLSVHKLAAIPAGWAFLDMCPDGFMSQSLNSAGMNDLKLLFDVTKQGGTNKIRVYPVELIV